MDGVSLSDPSEHQGIISSEVFAYGGVVKICWVDTFLRMESVVEL